jgi:phosphatidylserine decarboxylase
MTGFQIAAIILVILFVLWRFFFFLRNPARKSNAPKSAILSPADGHVLYIRHISDTRNSEVFSIKNGVKIFLRDLMFLMEGDPDLKSGWLVGIAMSPADVHFNRAPIEGYIEKTGHEFPKALRKNFKMFEAFQNLLFDKGKPYKAYPYLIYNERASFIISNNSLKVYVTQIADSYVKKIVTYKDKENIKRGEIFGLIRMGSQVDIFIPDTKINVRIVTNEGKHIKAGKDIVAWYET